MAKRAVVIVGSGLSGLWAASLLSTSDVAVTVLEARDRVGGRILSLPALMPNGKSHERFDFGGSWIWPEQQPRIMDLIDRFKLATFPQHASGSMLVERFRLERASSYTPSAGGQSLTLRIVGGVQSLVEKVEATLPSNSVRLQSIVKAVVRRPSGGILLRLADSEEVYADKVILAFPPRLIARNITFDPPLPPPLSHRMLSTPTWVGSQAKVIAVYDSPFWRTNGFSGMASSFIGPLQEIHDASYPDGKGALMGFSALTPMARERLGEPRLGELILAQLERLFGEQAREPLTLLMKDWAQESFTATPEDWNPANAYPVYGLTSEQHDCWDGQLVFAGSESAEEHGGYLEGAISSADRAAMHVLE